MPNYVTTSLPDYVQTNRDMIIKGLVLGGDTIRRMVKQTGVKKDAFINLLDLDPTFQDGAGCGFTADGDATISQREIETGLVKINMEICDETLRGKYAEYAINTAATKDGQAMPFEEYFVEELLRAIAEKMELAVWRWDSSQSGEYFDGLLTILAADADVLTESISAGATAYEGIKQVMFAIPGYAKKKGAKIFVAPEIYDLFIQELVDKNLYHFNPADQEGEYLFPGTKVTVVSTDGLANSLNIVATFDRNMYYGCDLESDKEEVKIWWSDDDDVWKVKVKWNAGVQVAFPDQVVLGTFAAAPVPGTAVNSNLAAIAAAAGKLAGAVNASDQIETHPNS